MKRIITIGEVLVDMMMTDFPLYEAKFGGAPANVAMNLAKFGSKTSFLGNFGSDHLGKKLYEKMHQATIDLSCASQKGQTSLAFVSWDEKGERDFQFYSASDQDYQVPTDFQVFQDDLVHFGAATAFLKGNLEKSYEKVFNQALQKGAFISFDPNYRHDLIKDLDHFKRSSYRMIQKSDLIKLSREEAEVLYGTSDPQVLKTKLPLRDEQIYILTLGEKGSYLFYQAEEVLVESISVEQVDSTGAGDAFVSALLYLIAKQGIPDFAGMKDYLRIANRVGALTSTEYGAIDAVPDIKSVIDP